MTNLTNKKIAGILYVSAGNSYLKQELERVGVEVDLHQPQLADGICDPTLVTTNITYSGLTAIGRFVNRREKMLGLEERTIRD